jgi:hypothetical protein
MMHRLGFVLSVMAGLASLLAPLPARAQERESDSHPNIPAEYRPPAGMCRIWLDEVPASRQPAPTDCATAIRRRPPNSRVVFGDDPSRDQRVPVRRSFTPPQVKSPVKPKPDEGRKVKPVDGPLPAVPSHVLRRLPLK